MCLFDFDRAPDKHVPMQLAASPFDTLRANGFQPVYRPLAVRAELVEAQSK